MRDVPTMHMHNRVNGSLCVCICVSVTGETLIREVLLRHQWGKRKVDVVGTLALCFVSHPCCGLEGLRIYELMCFLNNTDPVFIHLFSSSLIPTMHCCVL